MPAVPLKVVALVVSSRSEVAALDHVSRSISSDLDGSVVIPLDRACPTELIRLLDRIWDNSEPTADKSSSWSLCQYLRTDIGISSRNH